MLTEKIYNFKNTNTRVICNPSIQAIMITHATYQSEIHGNTDCRAFFDLIRNCLYAVANQTPLPSFILTHDFKLKTNTEKGRILENVNVFTLDVTKTLHIHSAFNYLHLSYGLLKNIFASEAHKAFYA